MSMSVTTTAARDTAAACAAWSPQATNRKKSNAAKACGPRGLAKVACRDRAAAAPAAHTFGQVRRPRGLTPCD